MKMKVYGIEKVDYVNKEGKRITGTKLHVTHPSNRVNGLMCEGVWISSSLVIPSLADVTLGSDIDVDFNRWAQVEFLNIVK